MKRRERQILAWVMTLCMVICLASSLKATDIFAAAVAEDETLTEADPAEDSTVTDVIEDGDQDTDESGDDQDETEDTTEGVENTEEDLIDGEAATVEEVEEEGEEAEEEVAEGITGKSKIVVGAMTTLYGTATTAPGMTGSWESDQPSVATVSGTGDSTVVTGVKAGTATITHTYYVTTESVGWFGLTRSSTNEMTESFTITVLSYINHYKLANSSSNINLWATSGNNEDLVSLSPGGIFETTSDCVYFYVRVKNGYSTGTSFRHVYTYGDPTREVFPDEWSGQNSIYKEFGSAGSGHPGYADAEANGCQYMCWYTGTNTANGLANFWAQFEITATPVEIQVVYEAEEGAVDVPVDGNTYYHKNVIEYSNNEITIPNVYPTYNGKKLQYWIGSDGRTYVPGKTYDVDDNIWNALENNTFTLTAQWKENEYKLSYDGNGSTSGGPVIDTADYKKGDLATTLDCTYAKYNYDFLGWNTKSDGSGDTYQAGEQIEINGNTTLYAKWGVKGNVTIKYIVAGEVGGFVKNASGEKVTSYTETFDPSEGESPRGTTAVAETGYNFVGWEDVTDTSTVVSVKKKLEPAEPSGGWPKTITYQARFEKQPSVTIKSNSLNVVYDGTEHSVSGYTVNGKSGETFVIDGVTYTIKGLSASASLTDAGSATVSFNTDNLIITNSSGKIVTDLLNIKYETGTLTVVPRPILLKSGTASKKYDGKPLTCDEVTASYRTTNENEKDNEAFVNGDDFKAKVTGSRTLVGSSENTFTYELELKEGSKSENYDIEIAYGSLTVENRDAKYEITLVPNSGIYEYDGDEHRVSGFVTTSFEINEETYNVTGVSASKTAVKIGDYPYRGTGTPVVTDSEGNDVSKEFSVIFGEGVLSITGKYTLTINYVDLDGNKLADPYVGKFDGGAVVGEITSPAVSGYTPEYSTVIANGGIMPEMDVTVDVVYEKDKVVGDGGGIIVPDGGVDDDDKEGDKVVDKDKEDDADDDNDANVDNDNDNDNDGDSAGSVTPGNNNGGNNNGGNNNGGNNNGGTTGNTTPGNTTSNNNGGNAGGGNDGDTTTITDGEVPMGIIEVDEDGNAEIVPATIDDEEVPEAAGEENLEKWALINFLAAIFTVLIALALLITWITGRKKREEDEKYSEYDSYDDDEKEAELKRHGLSRIAGVIAAAASVITFIFTENMSNPMTMTDSWTILMIVILVIEIIFALLAKKSKKDDEKNDNGEAVLE